jgi:tRNA1Val (adenine37-N6)-methyltransferase
VTLLTHDSISLRGSGIVTVTQPAKGFRFTLDSLLLADFCRVKPHDRILEPGAGTGIISLLLARKFPTARFTAVEIEPRAYELLRLNIEANGLSENIVPLAQDIGSLNQSLARESFDVIVANPPYTRSGTGRKSPFDERRIARQDETASLLLWLELQCLLKNKGRYILVFPANRVAELISHLRERKLEPKQLRFAHPFKDKPASIVLIEAIKSGGTGLTVLSPLIVHEEGGGYTTEMRALYGSGCGSRV